jgi:hypothetical protein
VLSLVLTLVLFIVFQLFFYTLTVLTVVFFLVFQAVPFIVLSDGTIRTDRVLQKAERDTYVMEVMAQDGGKPPLNFTAQVGVTVGQL